MTLNPVWHDVGKQEKCSSLEPPRDNFYKTQWAGQGVKINPIDVNFHLQKSLEMFEQNSADKIWSKKDRGIKVSPSVQETWEDCKEKNKELEN